VRWLLDTNTVSENVRTRPNQTVVDWIARLPPADAAISIVTLAELREGVSSAPSEKRRRELSTWLDESVIPYFADRTLQLNGEILVDWLSLNKKLTKRRITRSAPDLLIASTARVHNLIVVTRNVRDFADTGVTVYDPWVDATHRMDDP
jgi:predicted nucleic acid-binding protein